jgi:hypothetical protein
LDRFYIFLGSKAKLRACDGQRGGGAQRPVWGGSELKKTGARSARARTRGQNPLVINKQPFPESTISPSERLRIQSLYCCELFVIISAPTFRIAFHMMANRGSQATGASHMPDTPDGGGGG